VSEESVLGRLKQAVVGRPIPSHLAHHERLNRTTGLAVLSSDALSSVAYATEEIVRTLLLAGAAALSLATPIAGVLLILFKGDTHALIPLYMVGVFLSFTLSQAGMVLRWRRLREGGWRRHAGVNAIGAVLTGLVLLVVAATKFSEGAWIILALIPVHVLWFRGVHKHYGRVAAQLSLRDYEPERRRGNTVIIPIGGVHRAVLQALEYARSLNPDVRAVYVDVDPQATQNVRKEWERWGQRVPLIVLDSPYRSLMEPLLEYIDQVDAERPNDYVTILLPEFVPARWWHHILHNQRALLIKGALLFRRHIVVTSVPFHLAS
jgi:hypothetical protein